MNIFQQFLRIIYPELCFACRELVAPGEILCLSCLESIKPVASRIFPLKGHKQLTVYALGAYDNALHKLVTAKFRRSLPAARAIGRLMVQLLPEEVLDVDLLVPVPLHWRRYANRGYNQAVEIAKIMSKKLGIPYRSVLMRQRSTVFQYLLSREARQKNVEDVFVLRPGIGTIEKGLRILLIDDLCTSGVTLQAAANTLMPLQANVISAAVCARALS
ncbi:ComF family protein [Candidatus Dependentiae bacterium]|nr:ComF family protein [Candidatus Dependentiae bacterium]